MKRFLAMAVLTAFLCAGCGANVQEESSSPVSAESSVEASAESSAASEELDAQAFLEDYDYFWTTLRENCPLLEPAKRAGIDVDRIEKNYRRQLSSCSDLTQFYDLMKNMSQQFNSFGHISIVRTTQYQDYRDIYNKMGEGRAFHSEILNKPEVQETYEQLTQSGMSQETAQVMQLSASSSSSSSASVTLEEITPETMLVTVPTFSAYAVDSDGPVLREIYQEAQASGKENLILDLTQNGGGTDRYWKENIVAPNISEPVLYDQYCLVPMTEYNQRFYDTYEIAEYLHPISELPDFLSLNQADIAACDQFCFVQDAVFPADSAPLFQGKIWVLTSSKVFSAADSFANYCKQTGFATLVGEPTSGDGMGFGDPFLMELPNTHLVFRYTGFYGLNPDGSCNAEVGTAPDIPLADGKTALGTCLEAIASQTE